EPFSLRFHIAHFKDKFDGALLACFGRRSNFDVASDIGRNCVQCEMRTACVELAPRVRPRRFDHFDPEHLAVERGRSREILDVKHCTTQSHPCRIAPRPFDSLTRASYTFTRVGGWNSCSLFGPWRVRA